jgi:hypothetical protein
MRGFAGRRAVADFRVVARFAVLRLLLVAAMQHTS